MITHSRESDKFEYLIGHLSDSNAHVSPYLWRTKYTVHLQSPTSSEGLRRGSQVGALLDNTLDHQMTEVNSGKKSNARLHEHTPS